MESSREAAVWGLGYSPSPSPSLSLHGSLLPTDRCSDNSDSSSTSLQHGGFPFLKKWWWKHSRHHWPRLWNAIMKRLLNSSRKNICAKVITMTPARHILAELTGHLSSAWMVSFTLENSHTQIHHTYSFSYEQTWLNWIPYHCSGIFFKEILLTCFLRWGWRGPQGWGWAWWRGLRHGSPPGGAGGRASSPPRSLRRPPCRRDSPHSTHCLSKSLEATRNDQSDSKERF